MAMDRIQVGEQTAATEMNVQASALADTLRATQARAEHTSIAMQGQQRIANDLEAYVDRFHGQGRSMISNSEQRHWSIVRELSQTRSDIARVESEAERKVRTTRAECETHVCSLELSARAAHSRAHSAEKGSAARL